MGKRDNVSKLFKVANPPPPSGILGKSLSSEECSITSNSSIDRTVKREKNIFTEHWKMT